MRTVQLLLLLFVSTILVAQNSTTEILSFSNACANPSADSSGTVIRTKFPFTASFYMATVRIEGYNYGSAETIDLTLNWYMYQNASNQPLFTNFNISSAGGYAPSVQLLNENGFVSIFLRRGSVSQYCQNFRVKAWLRQTNEAGSSPTWFTGWSAAVVNEPPTGDNWTTLPYKNRLGSLNTSGDVTLNGITVGIGKGASNTYFGNAAFSQRTTGNYNTVFGQSTLTKLTVGEYNTALGAYSLLESIGGSRSVAVGFEAMRGFGSSPTLLNTMSTAIGFRALRGNATLVSKNTGVANTVIGSDALYSNEAGSHNYAGGLQAMFYNIRGNYNVAIGSSVLQENRAKNFNTAIGYYSQFYANSDTTSANTFNTSLGAYALRGSLVASNNTGTLNNAFGAYALLNNTSGSQQNAFGQSALYNSVGNQNAAFGNSAGYDVTTGINNVFIGHNTGRGITTGGGNTVIGASIPSLPATLTNTIILGAGGLERMRINQNGNVGIGNTSSYGKLEVFNSSTSDEGNRSYFSLHRGSQVAWQLGLKGNDFVIARGGGAVRDSLFDFKPFVITNSGNVGIGNTAPAHKLDISASSMRLNNSAGSAYLYVSGSGSSAYAGSYIYLNAGTTKVGDSFNQTRIDMNRALDSTGNYQLSRMNNGAYTGIFYRYDDPSGHSFYSVPNRSSTITSEVFRIRPEGNVGIGVSVPYSKLHVKHSSTSMLTIEGDGTSYGNAFTLYKSNNGANMRAMGMFMFDQGGQNEWFAGRPYSGSDAFVINRKGSLTTHSDDVSSLTNGGNPNGVTRMFTINNSGNVGIGTTNIPSGYKLAVAGNVIADKIKVKKSTNGIWPDFVFKKDYHLPSLSEIEKYVNENSHLPEIPSAAEVEKDGQDLGEMNRLLLKKVEELTLYLIEHEKKNKEQDLLIQKLLKK